MKFIEKMNLQLKNQDLNNKIDCNKNEVILSSVKEDFKDLEIALSTIVKDRDKLEKNILKEITPYGLKITNPTKEKLTVELFNEDFSLNEIKINVLHGKNINYDEFIKEINDKTEEICLIRLASSNKEQLKEIITFISEKGISDGSDLIESNTVPVIPNGFAKASDKGTRDLLLKYVQKRGIKLTFHILPETTLSLRLYPKKGLNKEEVTQKEITTTMFDSNDLKLKKAVLDSGESMHRIDGRLFDSIEEADKNKSILGNPSEVKRIMRNSSLPFSLEISNTTDEPRKVVLFGSKQHLLTENFGSDKELKIETSLSNISYIDLLNQFSTSPTKIGLIRLVSNNLSQLKEPLNIIYHSDEGVNENTILIDSKNYYSANQFQSGFNDILFKYIQNGDTSIEFTILPYTTLGFRLYEDSSEEINCDDFNFPKWKGEYSPIGFIITNKSNEIKNAVLFGFGEYYNQANFGSDKEVEIKTVDGTSYEKVLTESAFNPFSTRGIKLESSNISQIRKPLFIKNKTTGGIIKTPIFCESYIDSLQFQSRIVEMPYKYIQNNNTELCIEILPYTTLKVYIYKDVQVDLGKWLEMQDNPVAISVDEYNTIVKSLFIHKKNNEELIERINVLENKKWWHFFFNPKEKK